MVRRTRSGTSPGPLADIFSTSSEQHIGLRLGQLRWPPEDEFLVNHAGARVRDRVWRDLTSSHAPLVLAGFASITGSPYFDVMTRW